MIQLRQFLGALSLGLSRKKGRSPWRPWRYILLGVLALLLLTTGPSWGQTPVMRLVKAPVVLDGRVLFQVGQSANLTAAERADVINLALQDAVRSPQPVEIEVSRVETLAVIRNRSTNRNLLTVTDQDVALGTNPYAQAQIWRPLIEAELRRGQLERSPSYYRQALLFAVGVLVVAIASHFLLRWLGRFAHRHATRWLAHPASSLHPWEKPTKLMIQLAVLGMQAGLWVAVGLYVTDLFPEARGLRYELFNFLTARIITLGESNYSALELLLLLAFTIGLWFAVSGLTRLFKFYILERTGAEARVQDVVAILTQYVLTFLGLIVLLQIWGVDVRGLAILASVLGVGIGFGVQNITNNLVSGLIITLERPIQVGDFVRVGEMMGTVSRIGARSTEISTLDQVSIIVPNSRFLETEVVNWSHGNPVSRLKIPVGVAYDSDVSQVQTTLLEAAKSHPDVLVKPAPMVWFQEFGENALRFELMVWVGEPKKQFKVRSDLYYRIEANLRRQDIRIPFPQRDLHLRSPHLETLVEAWLGQSAGIKPAKITHRNGTSDRPSLLPVTEIQNGALATLTEISGKITEKISGKISGEVTAEQDTLPPQPVDLESLVVDLRAVGGLEVRDRRYRSNVYLSCFAGAELVKWLAENRNLSREEAIQVGQTLIDQQVIHHVLDQEAFQDGYVFYRFYQDEDRV